MIVGSGNLTPGGLRQNFEAFSIVRAPSEVLDWSSWDRFRSGHADNIRPIDQEALDRAAQNTVRRQGRDVEPASGAPAQTQSADSGSAPDVEVLVGGASRFLVARVPRGGQEQHRWNQVHLNRAVIDRFFRVKPRTTQRVYLVECRQDGHILPTKRCGRASTAMRTRNLKIENRLAIVVKPYPENWTTNCRLPRIARTVVRVHAAHARRLGLRCDVPTDREPSPCGSRPSQGHHGPRRHPRRLAHVAPHHGHRRRTVISTPRRDRLPHASHQAGSRPARRREATAWTMSSATLKPVRRLPPHDQIAVARLPEPRPIVAHSTPLLRVQSFYAQLQLRPTDPSFRIRRMAGGLEPVAACGRPGSAPPLGAPTGPFVASSPTGHAPRPSMQIRRAARR